MLLCPRKFIILGLVLPAFLGLSACQSSEEGHVDSSGRHAASMPTQSPTQQPPEYEQSAVSITVDNFLITVPIPIEVEKACALLVYPQKQFTIDQSLQAGLDQASLMVPSDEPGAPRCRNVWIAIAGHDAGFYLTESDMQNWVKAADEFEFRIPSPQIDKPDDWVAALWQKTERQEAKLPTLLKTYLQDGSIQYDLYLGSLPARELGDPQWNKAFLAKETADPLADQKIALLKKGDAILILAEDDLSFRLRRLNTLYTIDDFHASAALARQIETVIRSANTLALNDNLKDARDELLKAQQMEDGLSQGVVSVVHPLK